VIREALAVREEGDRHVVHVALEQGLHDDRAELRPEEQPGRAASIDVAADEVRLVRSRAMDDGDRPIGPVLDEQLGDRVRDRLGRPQGHERAATAERLERRFEIVTELLSQNLRLRHSAPFAPGVPEWSGYVENRPYDRRRLRIDGLLGFSALSGRFEAAFRGGAFPGRVIRR
jgi:hypothetical protein